MQLMCQHLLKHHPPLKKNSVDNAPFLTCPYPQVHEQVNFIDHSVTNTHRLGFTPVVQPVRAKITPRARLFHAAKRQVSINQRMAVDPYRTGLQAVGIVQRLGQIAGPDAGGQAEVAVVGQAQRLFAVGDAHQVHDRAKHLFAS